MRRRVLTPAQRLAMAELSRSVAEYEAGVLPESRGWGWIALTVVAVVVALWLHGR